MALNNIDENSIDLELQEISEKIGDLSELKTTNKTDIVSSINEVVTQLGNVSLQIEEKFLFQDDKRLNLSFISDEGHLTIFDGSKAVNGNYAINSSGASGYISNSTAVSNANWVNFGMPIGVAIGDSTAEGHPGAHGRLHSDSSGTVDLNRPNTPGQLSYHLELQLGIRVFNHGIGGQTSQQVRDRWHRDVLAQEDLTLTPSKTLEKKPGFVSISVGINDIFGGVTVETIIDNVEYMIDSALSNGIRPIVFNVSPHKLNTPASIEKIKQYNSWLLSKSKITPDMVLIDYYSVTNDITNDGYPKAGVFVDNIHPTKSFYEVMAKKVMDEAFSGKITRPKNLGFSTAIDATSSPSSLARPEMIIVKINEQTPLIYRIPNTPYEILELQWTGIADKISIKIVSSQQVTEGNNYAVNRKYISEVWITGKESTVKAIGKVETLPTALGVEQGRFTLIRAGVHDSVNAENPRIVTGVAAETTSANSPIITKGLAYVYNSADTFNEGDYIFASATARASKVTDMTVQNPVAKYIKRLETNYILVELL
ncbi:SGNH/GDSL hydrolase family protein [Psychrobacillus lasiicapitis]|uniref:SGNH hydrolase-type esterase domain-containing protein n=1 Tax=Psychrobacillus lasiicapitis TaxID=1636719 RepID=A0A544TAJ9_9BACI|nr:GDSL-type esterase/lipase family protein [Psychrobacillus lasiicapitis]TQR14406.1 hypothetical protein FG382_08080 [Psychrobacillus lasiicapitis]GGA31636.1 hypothetical protein GCM10011384_21450 [Psychrobacillus lasiicapitis]